MEERRKYQTHIITCLIILLILVVAAILSNQNITGRVMDESILGQKDIDTAANFDEVGNRIDMAYSWVNDHPEDQPAGNINRRPSDPLPS